MPGGGPGVAAASYADQQYGLSLFNWLFADNTLQKQWAKIAVISNRGSRLRIAKEATDCTYSWRRFMEPDVDRPGVRLAAADATPFSVLSGVVATRETNYCATGAHSGRHCQSGQSGRAEPATGANRRPRRMGSSRTGHAKRSPNHCHAQTA